jgi:hypothetical protein
MPSTFQDNISQKNETSWNNTCFWQSFLGSLVKSKLSYVYIQTRFKMLLWFDHLAQKILFFSYNKVYQSWPFYCP